MFLITELIVLGQLADGQWMYFAEHEVLNWADGLMSSIGVQPWEDMILTPRVISNSRHDDVAAAFIAEKFSGLTPRPITLEHWAHENGIEISLRIPDSEMDTGDSFVDAWASSPLVLVQDVFAEIRRCAAHRISGGAMARDCDLPKCMRGKGLELTRRIDLYL